MNPRPVDPDVVQAKLRLLHTLLGDLALYRNCGAEDLEGDRTARYVVERILTSLVDVAVGLNVHLVVGSGGAAPTDQRSSFVRLGDLGFIDEELAGRLAPSAGLRNVLVHEYADIDHAKVAAAIAPALDDFAAYVAALAAHVAEDG